mmetsp:Transcript_12950/g.36685  ORF Transcript_12950/g.36685 Transcript_12950/m.36685 type:complete len:225 (+) Transcript_12950:951-1625(+)
MYDEALLEDHVKVHCLLLLHHALLDGFAVAGFHNFDNVTNQKRRLALVLLVTLAPLPVVDNVAKRIPLHPGVKNIVTLPRPEVVLGKLGRLFLKCLSNQHPALHFALALVHHVLLGGVKLVQLSDVELCDHLGLLLSPKGESRLLLPTRHWRVVGPIRELLLEEYGLSARHNAANDTVTRTIRVDFPQVCHGRLPHGLRRFLSDPGKALPRWAVQHVGKAFIQH